MAKVALITGGTGGIGISCVRAFAQAGWSALFTTHSRIEQAQAMAAELREQGCDAGYYPCDVASEAQVNDVIGDIMSRYHHIDALICNAGIAHTGLLTDMTDEQWDHLFDVNVKGAFHCVRAALPGMISRRQGSVTLISSMWGQVGASCEVAYSATKAALMGMTKALAKEVGPSGVRVNCICPGVIDTPMNAHLTAEDMAALADETPLQRIGTPMDVANMALFLCGDGASFVTGQIIGVNGGFV